MGVDNEKKKKISLLEYYFSMNGYRKERGAGDSSSRYWFLMNRSVFFDPSDNVVSKKQLIKAKIQILLQRVHRRNGKYVAFFICYTFGNNTT